MNWHRASRYHIESADRGYTVARAWVNGAWIYDAWSRHTRPATRLHTGDKHACINTCDQHAQQQQGKTA